jgi:hypothetical protein
VSAGHGDVARGGTSVPPSSRSLFTEAYVAALDGARVIVEDRGLVGQVRRGTMVAIGEADPASRTRADLLVQWHDRHDVSTIDAARFVAPRYSIRVVARAPRSCRFCGGEVTSTKPDVDFCRFCFYDGTFHSERFRLLLDEIEWGNASVVHTGGGCFGIEVLVGSERERLFATLDGDAVLPDDESGPWWLCHYGEDVDDEGTLVAEHLDRAALVAAINGWEGAR